MRCSLHTFDRVLRLRRRLGIYPVVTGSYHRESAGSRAHADLAGSDPITIYNFFTNNWRTATKSN
jgi:hypothetical protein